MEKQSKRVNITAVVISLVFLLLMLVFLASAVPDLVSPIPFLKVFDVSNFFPSASTDVTGILLFGFVVVGGIGVWATFRRLQRTTLTFDALTKSLGLSAVRHEEADFQSLAFPLSSYPLDRSYNLAEGSWNGKPMRLSQTDLSPYWMTIVKLSSPLPIDGYVAITPGRDTSWKTMMGIYPTADRVEEASSKFNRQFDIFASDPKLFFELFSPDILYRLLGTTSNNWVEISHDGIIIAYLRPPSTQQVQEGLGIVQDWLLQAQRWRLLV